MFLKYLLSTEIQKFINQNLKIPVSKLALQKNPFPDLDYKIILNQIEAKSKCEKKLPTWFKTENIIYPSKISVEQTSSEITAKYKSELISGKNIIDLSGGFGIDAYYFSKKVNHVVHCEINTDLSEIVSHNFQQLGVSNCKCLTGDSYEILQKLDQKFEWLYVDPSRRNETKGKVFMLKDCLPNVVELNDFYFRFTNNILIKTAPILDLTAGLSELKNIKTIHIVAVENEVKELFWVIEKDYNNTIEIKTINIEKNNQDIFNYNLNLDTEITYSLPKKYLYEPNAAIMKSGGFNEVANQFKLEKLHQHSHLYTSDNIISFLAEFLKYKKKVNFSKTEMKENFQNTKSNITIRNFYESVENIRKKWKISDGGNRYSFFTTDYNNNKIALICTKI